ncbi:MAG TPA: universal stress protein [Verrucomicrobiae bacterium]|jgi:nucleotide-binding universal stress UspA family protein
MKKRSQSLNRERQTSQTLPLKRRQTLSGSLKLRRTSQQSGRKTKVSPELRPEPTRELGGAIQLKTILLPVDFSPHSQKAMRYAISFAEQFGARLVLLHVVEPALYPTEVGYVPLEIDQMHRTMARNAHSRLESLIGNEISRGLLQDYAVRVGSPYLEITSAARDWNVDLIIIATHGYTGLKHILLGSTAERVIRHAPCPVLTVREREHDFV